MVAVLSGGYASIFWYYTYYFDFYYNGGAAKFMAPQCTSGDTPCSFNQFIGYINDMNSPPSITDDVGFSVDLINTANALQNQGLTDFDNIDLSLLYPSGQQDGIDSYISGPATTLASIVPGSNLWIDGNRDGVLNSLTALFNQVWSESLDDQQTAYYKSGAPSDTFVMVNAAVVGEDPSNTVNIWSAINTVVKLQAANVNNIDATLLAARDQWQSDNPEQAALFYATRYSYLTINKATLDCSPQT